jgi:sugar/nucleoside kinase (ribokinase family)
MSVPALPVPDADVLAESSRIQAGGGFNVMAAAARQGMPVLYAGGHGTGPWGDLVRKALADEGIAVLRDPDPNQDTGFVIALNQQAGGRVYVTQLGSESARPPGSLDQIPVTENDAVYISGYGLLGPDSGPVLAKWTENLPPRTLLFLDPGPLVSEIPPSRLTSVLQRCTWLSLNATEATALTGTADPTEACRILMARLPTGNVIVRSGAEGCHLATASDRSVTHIPAPKVNAVDTTGAGDTHAGVFLAALSDGLPPVDAAERANKAAAMSVTRPGPATAPTRAELDASASEGRRGNLLRPFGTTGRKRSSPKP